MKSRLALLLPLLAALGCGHRLPIDHSYSAKSQDSRVQFLIIHFTSDDWPTSLKTLTQGEVSAHYLVQAEPVKIYQLVPEERRAYQAGVSSWKGQTALNAASIGIEITNDGDTRGPDGSIVYHEYPKAQIDAVIALVKDIVQRHQIRPDRILGHSDIAPQRKVDPGPTFPWKRLADEGLITWPEPAAVAARLPGFQAQLPEVAWFQAKLVQHGFALKETGTLDKETRTVLAAFQMKYRPGRYDGQPDAETAALLAVLTGK